MKRSVRCRTILSPPAIDFAYLRFSLRCDANRKTHVRRRSPSRIDEADRVRPASADFHDADNVLWRARRSSSLRLSPSSSATNSIAVPSGSVVGSSSTIRPFSTRARKGLMSPLYGLPGCHKLGHVEQAATEFIPETACARGSPVGQPEDTGSATKPSRRRGRRREEENTGRAGIRAPSQPRRPSLPRVSLLPARLK